MKRKLFRRASASRFWLHIAILAAAIIPLDLWDSPYLGIWCVPPNLAAVIAVLAVLDRIEYGRWFPKA